MKQHHASLAPLYPLFALSILIILFLLVIKQYMVTSAMPPTVILPGGSTYLGK